MKIKGSETSAHGGAKLKGRKIKWSQNGRQAKFEGTKVYNRIDLTSKNATDSQVYYLSQNDVVYVEPNNSAITSSSLDNRASIIVSIVSVLITSTVLVLTRN